ncbi:Xaa-Pro dipeptidase [Metallosphaera sp. J1]|uniref:M24 family metallopeptidase n=1 Tax=Metallosphaera javensis (ex Hofmann et al. 2022) TaxID=99938 RepID=UPI001EDE36FC|nr:Xaa-Pro peptidase family protein [Metallosphaera javensis (ex Hofmann et al. 2022)]MCG3109381.1 Xaa-Pro dipeptidase [Metallosphaera javensis (ex Hofmann et al. 2022)]
MDYKNRVQRVKELLKGKADYLVLGPGSNMFYLTGFTEEPMERPILLILGDKDYMVAPKMYEQQLSNLNLEVRTYVDGEDPYSLLDIRKGSSLAIDDQLWSVFLIAMVNRFSPSDLIPASPIMSLMRSVKDNEEIGIMEEGLRIAEQSFMEFIARVKEGESECHLSQILEGIFREKGVTYSFSTILTSGPNTAMPHLRCTERKVHRGEPIIVDFGIRYKGYSTDTTRVVTIGKPSEEVMKIWEIVNDAVERAEEASYGLSGKEIDQRARNVIENRGYGKYFIHRTGHGIGIDVHEHPYISPDNVNVIPKNSVFTIEPGIYIPEKFGIRIEDMVVMEDRIRILSALSREIYLV